MKLGLMVGSSVTEENHPLAVFAQLDHGSYGVFDAADIINVPADTKNNHESLLQLRVGVPIFRLSFNASL